MLTEARSGCIPGRLVSRGGGTATSRPRRQECLVRERVCARHPGRHEASGGSDEGDVTMGAEGDHYVTECGAAWHRTPGAVAWLTKLAATLGPSQRTRLADHLSRELDCSSPPLEIEWKPLPVGLWTPPAVFVEAGNLLLLAFTDDGVPTWEISKKTEKRGEWDIIAKGTADSFEAAKAAALFEAAASWEP